MSTVGLSRRGLALLVLASFLSGIGAAASLGYGPLGVLSITITGGQQGSSSGSGFFTEPVTVSLENVTAGSSGSFNGTAKLAVPKYTKVEFELENRKTLRSIFNKFTVTVTVDGKTFTLDLYGNGRYEYYLYLEPGEYEVYIEVDYQVRPDAKGSYTNIVFLKAEADDSYDDDDYDDYEDDS
ncbi:MAG: hypothetical protein GXO15_06775 [Crenarchaeota archaeon]|nr:hypothetical protein [Thermoproteota archaeon]